MKSPKSGTIVSINVAVGATVNGGDLLAVLSEIVEKKIDLRFEI
jgi:biotin carboxyl carrier protein